MFERAWEPICTCEMACGGLAPGKSTFQDYSSGPAQGPFRGPTMFLRDCLASVDG